MITAVKGCENNGETRFDIYCIADVHCVDHGMFESK